MVTAGSGTYTVFYYEGDNKKEGVFTVGFTADEFKSQIDNLPNFNNYGITVTLETLDASGTVTSDPALIAKWRYLVEL